ncbi:MAG: hypothetical protein AB8C95_01395 [Phycisphaeraceae bacterium]
MFNGPKQKQRRVDVACGYALGAYLGVTLTWIGIMLSPGFAFFALLIAVAAGFFGTLRTIIGMPIRFWLIPVAALVYVKLFIICLVYAAPLVILGVGAVFSMALALPIYRLFKNDFAKTTPPWLCKACGYPLMGLTDPSCPECGEKFDPEAVPKMATAADAKDDRLQ